MKLSTLRKIDYYAGVPLCFLLDIFSIFLAPFRKKTRKLKNILFIELSEAGSLIIAYSAIKRLKKTCPDANLYFMVFKRHTDGLQLLDIIDEDKVLAVRDDNMLNFIIDIIAGVRKIWSARIDSVIDMELFSRATSILTFLSFASNRVGFYGYTGEGLYRGALVHNYKVVYNAYKHMALNFIAMVESLTNAEENIPLLKKSLTDEMITPLRLPRTKEVEENAYRMIKDKFPRLTTDHRLTVINPNAGELPIRAWPLTNFTDVAKSIIDSDEKNVVLIIGLPSAMDDARFMEEKIKSDRLVNLIGITKSLGDVVDLCHLSKILLTNDAGPAQYASLTKTNVVVFFGPETPLLYRPLGENVHPLYTSFSCSPCLTAANHRNSVCNDNKCIKSIPVSEVTDLCLSLLSS